MRSDVIPLILSKDVSALSDAVVNALQLKDEDQHLQMISLPILYEDEHLAVVNKPAGLLVHRSAIDRRETVYAMQLLRDQLRRWVYPLHRLDKATSGALVFALDREAARRMMRSFIDGQIAKSYLAVVRGFTAESACIDHPLRSPWDRRVCSGEDRERPAQGARTQYRRLATVELPYPVGRYPTARYSLIEAAPLTGRMHQIRRHLKHIFHPVIGDTTYGDGRQNEFIRQTFGCRRLLLHSRTIAFTHPFARTQVRVHAPLDEDFNALLAAVNWDMVALPCPS